MKHVVRDERGIALIITLLVVALLTITVIEFTYSVEIDQHMARNALNGLQASLLARSGIALGEALLLHDTNDPPGFDAFTEDWCPSQENFVNNDRPSCTFDATSTDVVVPDNMRLRVQIIDEGGKLNLNMTHPPTKQVWLLSQNQNQNQNQNPTNTTPQGFLFQSWRTALEHLMQNHGVDASASDALGAYWDQYWSNQQTTSLPGQPTPNPQLASATPATTSLPFDFPSLDDAAAWIPGFNPDYVRRLRPVVMAQATDPRWGQPRVNVNTATREVLSAIIPDGGVVDEIVSRRQQEGIKTIGEIAPLLGALNGTDPQSRFVSQMLGVNSNYFLIRASAIVNPNPITGLGGVGRTASMLVRRWGFQANPPAGSAHWRMLRLDWQKEGGAGIFLEKSDQEPGMEDGPTSSGG